MELHPQIIEKNGKSEFVVLPYHEFQILEEMMHDYEDLLDIREAKKESHDEKGTAIDKVISDLGL